jgi:hypothetical protein
MKLYLALYAALFSASVVSAAIKPYCESHALKYWNGNYTNTDGETSDPWEMDNSPVIVGFQTWNNVTGGSIDFKLVDNTQDTWRGSSGGIERVFVEYHDAATGIKTCVTAPNYQIFTDDLDNRTDAEKGQIEFEASCMLNVPYSIVTITVLDEIFNPTPDPKPPSCCRDLNGDYTEYNLTRELDQYETIEYVVIVNCIPDPRLALDECIPVES